MKQKSRLRARRSRSAFIILHNEKHSCYHDETTAINEQKTNLLHLTILLYHDGSRVVKCHFKGVFIQMMNAKEWKQEEERLAMVTAKLQEKIHKLEPEVTELYDQVSDIRKRFWEEVSVNTSNLEDFKETFFTIKQQTAVLSERERTHKRLKEQWEGVNRLLPSPYFGRVDFLENGMATSEQIYIGVSSFLEDGGMEFLIYDWRTPIASLYYDHAPGPAAFDTPGGIVAGEMQLKRQYQIADGKLRHMFDASVTIGDELLQQALGQGADARMKSIVATIQREQNAIIRDDKSRMLIVQGVAGSGKTSAALQRVAYLLYKHREKLKADQIVLFSPNAIFNSYVSSVLPELGEENMQQTTFQEYLDYWLKPSFELEDLYDQIEYVLASPSSEGYEARISGIHYKASTRFIQAIQSYARWLVREGMQFISLTFRGAELISAEQMAARFYSYEPNIRLANRIELLQEWLYGELKRLEKIQWDSDWVQEELQYLAKEQYAEVSRSLRKERGLFDFAEVFDQAREKVQNKLRRDESDIDYAAREEELLSQAIVKERFKPLRRFVKRLEFVNVTAIYSQLFNEDAFERMTEGAERPARWHEICEQTRKKLACHEMFYEDATPYLLLKELIEGLRTNTEVRHVLIDEGQDYSMFQYEYLKRLFPRARMTVLGDFGQAIFTQSTNLSDEASPLVALYGEKDTRLIRLEQSYRSTREIVEFTRALLPQGGQIEAFDRRGSKPRLIRTPHAEERMVHLTKELAELRSEGTRSVAVITRTAAESKEAFDQLRAYGLQDIQLVTKDTISFEQGMIVIPAYLAKGVEFDAVLIYDASSSVYHRESERKLFYTACTRAMHRLSLYAAGEWTPYLQCVDPQLYEEI